MLQHSSIRPCPELPHLRGPQAALALEYAGQYFARLAGAFAPRRQESWRGWLTTRWLTVCGAIAFAIACIGVAGAMGPQSAATDAPMMFEIPAQPLAAALQAYGQRAGVQVLYESESAAGRQSVAVEGEFTRDRALELLLSGTDLEVHYTKPDAITLSPRHARYNEVPPANPLANADLSIGELRVRAPSRATEIAVPPPDYSESVQLDIQSALRKNAKTRSGNYRAVLDLWIDSTRVIEKTALLQSTGEADRDAAVTATLQGLTTSRPPPVNTPQPVRVVIVVKTQQ